MDKETEKFKKYYYSLNYVECPAFSNEKVYFTSSGYNHIWRKGRFRRKQSDIERRRMLFKHVRRIISESNNYQEYIEIKGFNLVRFWSFESRSDRIKITIIIRQIDNKEKHFFSVFGGIM